MNKEKESALISKYKYMFEEFDRSKKILALQQALLQKYIEAKDANNETAMAKIRAEQEQAGSYYPIAFGFEHDDGWYDILDRLMAKIQEIDTDKSLRIHQIKEKFGGLRFYINGANDAIYDVISDAESESYKTCEVCGKPGKLCDSGHWLKTVCKEHRELETWAGYKQHYKPCSKFYKDQIVITDSDSVGTIVSLHFNENTDEWIYKLDNEGFYNEWQLKRKPEDWIPSVKEQLEAPGKVAKLLDELINGEDDFEHHKQ